MSHRDPDRRREYWRAYRERLKNEEPERYALFIEKAKIRNHESYVRRKQKILEKRRADGWKYEVSRDRQLREQVIAAYGGRCEICGLSELRFLTLDRSFGDGAEHRRNTGRKVYRDIAKRGFPKDEGYRVLCWNHNCGGAY